MVLGIESAWGQGRVRLLTLFLLVVLVVAGTVGYLQLAPYGPSSEIFITIPPGTRTPVVATELEKGGAIRSRYVFDLLRLVRGGKLLAGEYRFDHPVKMNDVYNRLLRGDVYTLTLTIPEGYNIFDIARTVEMAKLGSKADFLAAAKQHTELITDLSPNADSLEGFLFPDTYHFSRHTKPDQIVTAMVRRFRQQAAQAGLVTRVLPTVTLASLVEKETSVDSERPLVAGVFQNRLLKGMPLATDPTVIYAALLDDRYRGAIYASDLQANSSYNTYKHVGLPPGPICNPGMASLKAAINPAHTGYLYFVSDGNGHSKFSVTYDEHSAKVKDYRKTEEQMNR